MVTNNRDDEGFLINAIRLDGKGNALPIASPCHLETPKGEGFDWFHLNADVPETHSWMTREDIDPQIIDALTMTDTRPRCYNQSGGTVLILRAVNTNPEQEPEDMVSIRIWFNEHLLISTRRRKLMSVMDIKKVIENEGSGPTTPSEFVAMLTERITDRISDVVDTLDDRVTEIESHEAREKLPLLRKNLSILRRQMAALRRHLAPQREALDVLQRLKSTFNDDDRDEIRHSADRTIRSIEELDLARERTLVLQEELTNQIAEQQNSRMYVLSIVTTIFLPLSFLTGLLGMNVAGLPGTENASAFMIVCIGMLVIGIAVTLFMYWRKWM